MSRSRGGLGRGLAALIPTGPDTTTVADVLINGVSPGREPAALALIGTSGARPPGWGAQRVLRTGANRRNTG